MNDLMTKAEEILPALQEEKPMPETVTVKAPALSPLSGSGSEAFTQTLARQAIGTLWLHSDKKVQDKQINAALAAMTGVRPQDEIEGMLAAQMVGLHNAAMECMRRAMIPEQNVDGVAFALNQANKLTRSYAALVEALSRHRGKGVSEQKMTVEHVHVHAGGQAVVGNVSHGAGIGGMQKNED